MHPVVFEILAEGFAQDRDGKPATHRRSRAVRRKGPPLPGQALRWLRTFRRPHHIFHPRGVRLPFGATSAGSGGGDPDAA
jgi:hypothetical protein